MFSLLTIYLAVLAFSFSVSYADAAPEACTASWGWPGFVRGSNPWGAVLNPTQSSSLSNALSSVCATSISSVGTQTPVSSSSSSSRLTTTSTITISSFTSQSTFPSSVVSPSSSSITSSRFSTSTISTTSRSSSSSPASSSSPSISSTKLSSSSSTSSSTISTRTTTSTTISSSSSSLQVATSPSTSSTSASIPATTNGASSSDINTYLSTHNSVRAQHGASALVWNNTLASAAQQWANGCAFKHSGGTLGPFGENLAAGTGSSYDITSAVTSWTNEASQYDPNNPQASHFTQVVWKATTQLGCAVQSCSGIFPASYGPAKYFVCEYYPQGNVIGAFAQNVQA